MNSELESLLSEDLIRAKRSDGNYNRNATIDDDQESKILKSDKNATMLDLLKMLDKVITLTMSDLNVEFIAEEGKIVYLSNDQPLDHPLITYKVIDRKPSRKELKPRQRESFIEDKQNKGMTRIVEIYGQKFGYHLQFNVFASTYVIAENIMDRFEEMMLTYAGHFKKNGVGEIIFDRQFTDDNFKTVRQTLSVRNFSYFIELEKITVVMRDSIKDVDIIS